MPTDKPFRRCIIHIGTEKTGTSSIQHFLSMNRAALAEQGVLYTDFTGSDGGSQWGFVVASNPDLRLGEIGRHLGLRDDLDALDYRRSLTAAIDRQREAMTVTDTLIVSSEHFHSRLSRTRRIEALSEFLAPWAEQFLVVVYFRRQDRAAVSRHSTQIKSGCIDPLVFPPNTADGLPYYYDYAAIYRNWQAVFGEAAMRPGLFQPEDLAEGDVVHDFLEKIELGPGAWRFPKRVNQSLDARGIALLLQLNRDWPSRGMDGEDPSREALLRSIIQSHSGSAYPAMREEAQFFLRRFKKCNNTLHKLAFPDRAQPLFSDDFDDYPIRLSTLDGGTEEQIKAELTGLTEGRWLKRFPLRFPASLRGAAGSRGPQQRSRPARRPRPPKERQLPVLHLHVGLPKTATTTLQRSFFARHSDLYYLGKGPPETHVYPRRCRSEPIYRTLNALLWDRQDSSAPESWRRVIGPALKSVGGRSVLGSWEGLGIQRPRDFERALARAQALFPAVRVLFTLRNPLTRLVSAYLFALKVNARFRNPGHHSVPDGCLYLPFNDWLQGRLTVDGHDDRFDYMANLRIAIGRLGIDNVGVFLFEDMVRDPASYLQRMADFLGIDRREAAGLPLDHFMPAITLGQYRWLQQVQSDESSLRHCLEGGRATIRSGFEKAETADPARARITLDDEAVALITARSRDDHRWLAETFDLDLAAHGYPVD